MSKQESYYNEKEIEDIVRKTEASQDASVAFLKETGRKENAFMLAKAAAFSDYNSTEYEDLLKEFEQWKKGNNLN